MSLPNKRELQSFNADLTGLQAALCAYSFYRGRHVYKDRTKAKERGRKIHSARRIKDLSASGERRRSCRYYIRLARSAGWRGSFIEAVLSGQNAKDQALAERRLPASACSTRLDNEETLTD